MAKDEIAIPPQMPAMMPSRLDEIAKSDPDRAFISIPADPKDVSKGYRDISFSAMAIAINRLCAFLEPIIGCNESGSTSAVAYVGVIDPRPIVVLLALQKLGHTVLMTAPRNSVPMHLHIMATTDCKTLLHAEQIDPVTVVGSDDAGIEAVQIPSMDELFSDAAEESRAKNYDFNKPFEECRNDAIMILHTSGSTGMPKSVKIKHDHISVCATLQHMEPVAIPNSTGTPTTYEFLPTFAAKKRRCYVGFPPWHMGGLAAFTTMLAIFGEVTPVFSSWMTPPTGAAMMAAIKYGKVQAAFVPPAPMIELAGSEEGLEALSKLDFVFYGGGKYLHDV